MWLTCDYYLITGSMRSLEQKKQTHRMILSIFVMKQTWKTGLVRVIWPKCPGHVVMLPAHVWQREIRSITPWRGSINPPNLGLPPSIVYGYLIPSGTVTDILFCIIKMCNFLKIFSAIFASLICYTTYYFFRGKNSKLNSFHPLQGRRRVYDGRHLVFLLTEVRKQSTVLSFPSKTGSKLARSTLDHLFSQEALQSYSIWLPLMATRLPLWYFSSQ